MQAWTRTIGPESRKGRLDLGLAEVAVAGVEVEAVVSLHVGREGQQ